MMNSKDSWGLIAARRTLGALAAWLCIAGAVWASSFEQNGIHVDFALQPLNDIQVKPQANTDATFHFDIRDVNGEPVSGAYPAVWMQRRAESVPTSQANCQNLVKSFIGGSMLSQSTLNLNVYYVMVMNDDASISIVDPLFGFGGSKLLTMIPLSSPGYDWAFAEQQQRLFVSQPKAKKLAVIDTLSFVQDKEITLAVVPGRMAVQPDQHYLWLGYQQGDQHGGVLVIDIARAEIVARITTGAGEHQFSFSADSRYAFVASEKSGGVSVIDVDKLAKLRHIKTGKQPASMAYSVAAEAVYVTDRIDGSITAINAHNFAINTLRQLDPGLGQIRFAPGGRYAVVVNPENDTIYIWDAVSDRVIKKAKVEQGPDHVSFTDTLAHIRHRGSETIYMLSMDVITQPDLPIQVVDFPGGQKAFGVASTPADGIVQAPGENAVLVSHPEDRQVYYYKEGMAAPMGSFKNYNRRARAVLAVDRTLQETDGGHYKTVARLTAAGTYDVVFFMESPRVIHCFATRILPNKANQQQRPRQVIAQRLTDSVLAKGKNSTLRFRLYDEQSGLPLTGVDDLRALTVLVPGTWHENLRVDEQGDGIYSLELTPPDPGAYYMQLNTAWKDARLLPPSNLMFRVTDKP